MRDLTSEIIKSKAYQKTWSKEKLELQIENWKQADSSLKFDYEADEQWVRVLKENHVMALLGVNIPILFLSEGCPINNDSFQDIHIVHDENFDNITWNIDLKIFELLVPKLIWHASSDVIDQQCLSINDFWYATV